MTIFCPFDSLRQFFCPSDWPSLLFAFIFVGVLTVLIWHVLILWPPLLNAALLLCFGSTLYIGEIIYNCYSLCGYLLLLFSVILYIDQFTDNCCRLSVRNTPRSVGVILCSDRPWYIIEVVEVVYGYSSSRICGGSCGGSDHCAWPDVTGSDVSHVPCPEVCSAHAQPEVAQYPPWWGLLIGSEKVTWPEEVFSRSGPDRKKILRMPRFSPRVFLSSSTVVTWLPYVTEGHLIHFGVPLSVRMRNRKLRNTRSDRGHVTPLEVSLGCSLRRPRPITKGNPRVLYLAWWLELALVICHPPPFYFRIVSRLCSTLLRVHLKMSTCKMLFFYTFNV